MLLVTEPCSTPQTCMSRSHPCIEDGMVGDSGGGGAGSGGGGTTHSHPPPPPPVSSLPSPCVMCHVPYSETSLPFRVKISKCAVCR